MCNTTEIHRGQLQLIKVKQLAFLILNHDPMVHRITIPIID